MTILAILLLSLITTSATAEDHERARLTRFQQVQPHMGTRFVITLYASDKAQADAVFQAIQKRVAQIEQAMSDYRQNSEIRTLALKASAADRVTEHPVSDDLAKVMKVAYDVGQLSDGAFDVTIAPLSKLWRRARRSKELPNPMLRKDALAHVGLGQWSLRDRKLRVAPSTQFDLGGIAKGYALDAARAAARQHGVTRILIDGGGDLIAGDPPPKRDAWNIGIASLRPDEPPTWVAPLVRAAMATSGDAWQHVIIDGKRFSHLIDPRTGLGVEGAHSATVFAETAVFADAWASALCVLGPTEGVRLTKKLDSTLHVDAIITTVINAQPQQQMTPGFTRRAKHAKRRNTPASPSGK